MSKKWKIIFDGKYKVSNTGDVFSVKANKVIKPSISGSGRHYYQVKINEKCYLVHKITALLERTHERERMIRGSHQIHRVQTCPECGSEFVSTRSLTCNICVKRVGDQRRYQRKRMDRPAASIKTSN